MAGLNELLQLQEAGESLTSRSGLRRVTQHDQRVLCPVVPSRSRMVLVRHIVPRRSDLQACVSQQQRRLAAAVLCRCSDINIQKDADGTPLSPVGSHFHLFGKYKVLDGHSVVNNLQPRARAVSFDCTQILRTEKNSR